MPIVRSGRQLSACAEERFRSAASLMGNAATILQMRCAGSVANKHLLTRSFKRHGSRPWLNLRTGLSARFASIRNRDSFAPNAIPYLLQSDPIRVSSDGVCFHPIFAGTGPEEAMAEVSVKGASSYGAGDRGRGTIAR